MANVIFFFLSLVFAAAYGAECNCSLSEERVRQLVQNEVKQLFHHHSQKRGRRSFEAPVFESCPNGFVRHDDSCYIAAHDLANWPEAYVYCEAYGAHLAFIESAREQQFLSGYIHNLKGSSTDPLFYYWIGGTDAISETEWIWAKAIQPVKYTNWHPGEPNNNDHLSSKHQDCLALLGDTGLWDDGWCETKHNFICEIE